MKIRLIGSAEIRWPGGRTLARIGGHALVRVDVQGLLTHRHLRKLDGGQVAAHYMDSFERVWDTAKPWHGERT